MDAECHAFAQEKEVALLLDVFCRRMLFYVFMR